MNASDSFLSDLIEALQRSLSHTFGIFETGDVDFVAFLATSLSQLIVALLLIVLFAGMYWIVHWCARALLLRLHAPEDIIRPLFSLLRYGFIVLASLAILAHFDVTPEVLLAIGKAALIALLFYLAWAVVSKVLTTLLQRYELDRSIEQLLRNVVGVVIVAFAVVTVLAQFGFDILSVVAGLGIVGLAVGFAAQSTLSNLIAGITLLVERPFRIGDWVTINGQEGKVMRIALRTTWLRTRDNIFTMIPNDSVASADIINFSTEGPLRVRIPIGIAYKESIQAARDVIMPILEADEHSLVEPDMMPRVATVEMGDSSVNLVMLFWILPDHIDIQPRISARILERVKTALDDAGIEIPFPHLQLFIDDAKGLKPVLEPLYTVSEGAKANR